MPVGVPGTVGADGVAGGVAVVAVVVVVVVVVVGTPVGTVVAEAGSSVVAVVTSVTGCGSAGLAGGAGAVIVWAAASVVAATEVAGCAAATAGLAALTARRWRWAPHWRRCGVGGAGGRDRLRRLVDDEGCVGDGAGGGRGGGVVVVVTVCCRVIGGDDTGGEQGGGCQPGDGLGGDCAGAGGDDAAGYAAACRGSRAGRGCSCGAGAAGYVRATGGCGGAELGEHQLLDEQQRPDGQDQRERAVVVFELLAEERALFAAANVTARGRAQLGETLGDGRRARGAPRRSESLRASAASASEMRARTSSDLTDGTVVSIASAICS